MRTNIVLAVTAAVLAVPTALTLISDGGRFTEYKEIPRLFEGFTPQNIQYVVLSKPKPTDPAAPANEPPSGKPEAKAVEELILLQKEPGKWVLGNTELAGVPVRSGKVDTDVLEHLKKIRRDEKALVRSDAAEDWLVANNLTESTGMLVRALDANQAPMAELIVGKEPSEGKFGQDTLRGRLVRTKASKAVVLYEVDYWNLTIEKNDWIDLKVHQLEVAKVKTFSVRNASGKAAFEKENEAGSKWKALEKPEGVGAVREQEVANLLNRYQYLNAVRFLQPLKAADLASMQLD